METGRRRRRRAPTASRCCATPTATAWPRPAPSSSRASTRRSGWRWSGDDFYVANTDARRALPVPGRRTRGSPRPATKLVDLPAGPINHHWTKNLIASPDGSQALRRRSARTATSPRTAWRRRRAARPSGRSTSRPASIASSPRACATRSAWPGSPRPARLWTAVNERDEIGSDLVPDYMTSVRDGGFYGWPYSYFGAARRRARQAAAARSGRRGDRARLRARAAHRLARPRLRRAATACRRVPRTAPSSASTAPGTASRTAATR